MQAFSEEPASPSSSPSPSSSSSSSSTVDIWDVMTYFPNTFTRGPIIVSSTSAPSEEDCATSCYKDKLCYWWSYCPASAETG